MATEDALCMGLCLLIEWQMRAERSISQDVSHDENDWMVRFTDTPPFDGEAEKNNVLLAPQMWISHVRDLRVSQPERGDDSH